MCNRRRMESIFCEGFVVSVWSFLFGGFLVCDERRKMGEEMAF